METARTPPKGQPLAAGEVRIVGLSVAADITSEAGAIPDRFRARMKYITEPEITLAGLWEKEFHTVVPLVRFKRWALEDKWDVQRKEFWESASRRVLHRVLDATVQREVQEIEAMQGAL